MERVVLSRPRSALALLALLACLVGGPSSASAQRLFARVGPYVGELDTRPSRLASVLSVTALPSSCSGAPYGSTWPLDYGRQLAWTSPDGGLCVLDTTNGRVVSQPQVGAPQAASSRGFGLVSGYGGDLTFLTAPDGAPVHALVAAQIPAGVFGWSVWMYAVDAERGVALVLESDFSPPFNGRTLYPPVLTRVSMRTGAVLDQRVLPFAAVVSEIALNTAGDRLALATMDVYGSTAGVHLIDVDTTRVVASNTALSPDSATPGPPAVAWADDANRLIVVTSSVSQQTAIRSVAVLEASTLARVGTLDTAAPQAALAPGMSTRWAALSLLVDPVMGRAFVTTVERQSSSSGFPSWIVAATLQVFDVATLTRVAGVDLRQPLGDLGLELPGRLFLVSPPGRTTPSVQVSGRAVSMSWPASAGADYYVVSAGSAPGLGDVASFTTAAPGFSVAGAPPGRYHLRVRAVGAGGPGPWSDSVAVVVP